jgi:SpoVK/Ycf46/Vps4 family AAA+-type ATPase
MLLFQLQEGGRYASLSLATIEEKVYENIAKLSSGLLTFDNPKEGFVYALAKGAMGGYHLSRIGAAGTPIERGNYTEQVLASYDHVVTDLQGDSPCGRLVIMAGVPGGGKTFLARSLLSEVPKAAFVVVPPHLVRELGSPELLPALASARHDGLSGPICLIVEDADQVLVNRQAGDMSAISSLLNLGDGILGNVLDVRILATTNASKIDMDPATRRKGRLCSYVEVNQLKPDHAEQIVRRLTGKSITPNKDVTLAEVYGKARDLGWKPPPKVPPPSPYSKQYALY